MSRFDQQDYQGSAALDDVLADPVSFTPVKRQAASGDRLTIQKGRNTATHMPDPAREARPRAGETGFRAIVTWRSYNMGAGDNDGTKRDVLGANDVILDFDRRLFWDANGVETLPRDNDLFELPLQGGGTITVQQTRDTFDDGGARIVCSCIAPTG